MLEVDSIETDGIQVGECFVLCDAGGGTVVSNQSENKILKTNAYLQIRTLYHTK